MSAQVNRIQFLDGFRGLAIAMVIVFHAYVAWAEIVPYGNKFSGYLIFNKGWLGVQLFFLISGFVILMTLEKTKNFLDFIKKRWLRLFPSMLIATVLMYATANYFYERPEGVPELKDVIPGLVFLNPNLLSAIFHTKFGVLEGSFWSLYVEFKFYIIFGLFYFYLGKSKAILGIVFLFALQFISHGLTLFSDNQWFLTINTLFVQLGFSQFGWFASGSFLYLHYVSKTKKYLIYALIIGLLAALNLGETVNLVISGMLVFLIFVFAVCLDSWKRFFSNKFFVYLGFVSYPLYLIHQNFMISMIIKLNSWLPEIPSILLPLLPIGLLVLVSHIIAKYIEPIIYDFLKDKLFSKPKMIS